MFGESRVKELPASARIAVRNAHARSRFRFYKWVTSTHARPERSAGENSLKTGACGDDPNGVICAAGCHGGMKLKIPNPGVSGDASTAPLYEFFCRSRTYIKAMRTDARTTTIARVVARAITAADMIGFVVVGFASSDAGGDKGRNRLCHQDQGVVKTGGVFVPAGSGERGKMRRRKLWRGRYN